ncbi:hypothetical protein BJX63DRAFT_417869 [Aspergillus granulosus]|uniref:Xylanolytic transcriptional activator regulatory domain-containing protein n=1 Tax=Aspergillus granulosus TaxID=176169 RepID=A0ABR4I398_9EURO
MTEFIAVTGEILPAIKCDRQAPCANCVDSRVECQRLRRGRSSRKRTLQSALGPQESIINYERRESPIERRDPAPRNNEARTDLERSLIPGDRQPRPEERSPIMTAAWTPNADGSNCHAIQAKNIIQLELDDSRYISRERQSILTSALQLVSEIAESGPVHSLDEEPIDIQPDVPIPKVPPRELLFMLLRGPQGSVRIQWPDHISDKAFEKMAAALLQDDLSAETQLFHQYCVCIYAKAIRYLQQASRVTDDPVMRSQLVEARNTYLVAAIRSIEQFNILTRPSLSSIQALLSGASIMQYLGRFNQCWVLISYAARQITSLNYYKINRVPATSDQEQEIHSVVYWCYYLDRTLSSLLYRPPSLPDLEVSPADLVVLDPASPYDTFLPIIVRLAQIQGELHTVSGGAGGIPDKKILDTCQHLESRMQSMLPTLQSSRDSFPKPIQYEWAAVDFSFYAIFVEIHRTRLKASFSPLVHRECLVYARRSLCAFYLLQQHVEELPGFDDPYPSFLTWTLLLYPLSAFFVVFCNIVGTLDHDDYNLMCQITASLSQFKQDPHLSKLLNLLQSLEQLCEPLFRQQDQGGNVNSAAAEANATAAFAVTGSHAAAGSPVEQFPTTAAPFQRNTLVLGTESMPATELDFSADWMMWQLFNSQVPAGWLNPPTGDPFAG